MGTDSKAGTLVHEVSHFSIVAGTDDYAYGQSSALALAKTNPAKARMNADNHEFFTENKLKEFHFKIHPRLYDTNIKQILARFRTSFWLKEKQWFVNCDHHHLPSIGYDNYRDVHIYTLPYSDEQFYLCLSTQSSTNVCKDEYSTIKNLYFSIDNQYNTNIEARYYFPNLESLTICNLHKLISIDNLMNLSQIKHLTIQQNNIIHSTKLQSMTLSWNTLVEITNNFTNQQACSLLNKQIKILNLTNMTPNNDEDNRKSIEFLISIFSTSLEKLSLNVTVNDNILLILNEMPKLYSVKIECNPFNTTTHNEELSLWLMRNVPRLKNFTYQIQLAKGTRIYLLLWIGH
ncbi:unnamed protein product [Rotaria sp. Silwood1]|nr:unnamed protein product [Rotaria sp. Silwood1]CAF5051444.1 unnamed protein product [Rotaria sp. Silwood1]